MGLIRDAIGSALGANEINNGLSGGTRLPFKNTNNDHQVRRSSPSAWKQSSSSGEGYVGYADRANCRYSQHGNDSRAQYLDRTTDSRPIEQYPHSQYRSPMYRHPPDRMQPGLGRFGDEISQRPPEYEPYANVGRGLYEGQSYNRQSCTEYADNRGFSGVASFRPLALPQIAFGDGQPFLRGYSQELRRYSIAMEEFIEALDTINVAILPSPENQIFQKGANIAGWFLPGAAGIGLTVGQIGVGLGAAAGHSSQLSKALSNANMNLFLPNGLEICIGSSTDVDAEVGIPYGAARPGSIDVLPEERLACYGNLISPLSSVLPPLRQSGRNDPIALLGRGMSSRDSQKKFQKAQKKLQSGKSKDVDALEKGLKWLIVRQASADALAYWETNRR